MAKKTNKTSHVMDLLTNGASPEVETPAGGNATPAGGDAAGQEKAGDPQAQAHAVAAPKVTVVDEGSLNDRLSQEILSNLSKELKEDTPSATAPAGAGATGQTASTGATGTAGTAAAPEPETPGQMDGMSPPVSPVGQTHHAIIPKSQISNNLQTGEYRFVNVMEQLMLRQDVASFQEQYNVCKCKKCTADVCALALTGLPSKYVVTRKDALSPILSYYESKYKIFMLTELIKACNKVRESPRHKV